MEIFYNNNQNNHLCSNDLDGFLGMCDPPDVKPDDISEANYHNSFGMGVVEDKEKIELFSTTNAADEKIEVRAKTAYGGRNNEFTISGSGLLCETTSLLVRNSMGFTGPSQKNTSSRVSLLQPKEIHFHYFILKVPCFLQFFGPPQMTTILLWDKFHHLFYRYRVNNTVLLIFQLTFIQDSQIILPPQVQTIVT